MTKTLYLILLCLGTIVASEVHYVIIIPSQLQTCGDRCCNAETVDNHLTLSQFVNNSNDYVMNDTRLIFSPGKYSLESELIIENVHLFSMFAWPSLSLKAVLVCGHNARFEFRNVSIVTVSGLEFVGCSQNHVESVGQFKLENSAFFGNDQAIVNGKVLIIDKSTANLDRVAFVSVTDLELPENCTQAATVRVIGILLQRSSVGITQSRFEGNKVGLGAVICDEFGSDITIVNTTFVNNSASKLDAAFNCDFVNYNITSAITGGIVYTNSHGSTTVKIYDSKFVGNVGVVIFGANCSMLITHTKFFNNKYSAPFTTVYANDTDLIVSDSTFTNNTGMVLQVRDTSVSISCSEFVFNNGV